VLVKPALRRRAARPLKVHSPVKIRRPGRLRRLATLCTVVPAAQAAVPVPHATGAPVVGATVSGATVSGAGAPAMGSPPPTGSSVAGIAALADGRGYYVLRSDGEVDAFGAATRYGSVPGHLALGVTATGIALDPATGGYWVLDSMGQIFAFHAPYLGRVVVRPGGWGQYPAAVAISATGDGSGYYVLRADGTVVAFRAPFYGDLSHRLHYGATAPVVATSLATDPTTGGYYVLTSVGGVYSFHAPFFGAPAATGAARPLVQSAGIVVGRGGRGYAVAQADGDVLRFGATGRGGRAVLLPAGATAVAAALDARTGGLWVALDYTPVGGYLDPLRRVVSLVPQEVDQGVDYCGQGPVYAVGPGLVDNTRNPEWPGGAFISYRLSSGPAAGLVVYVAENVTPAVAVGQTVSATTVVGYLHDSGTCLETGWANAADPTEQAAAHYEYDGRNSTAYGLNFDSFLQALGARPGLVQPDGPPGPLAPGWPRW
jgi:hypothetical protein